MTTTDTTAPFLTLADLAARWGRCKAVARQVTRTRGFPTPVVLTPRTVLWPTDEVHAWEQTARKDVRPARRRVTPVQVQVPTVRLVGAR